MRQELRACRAMLRGGSKSFFLASWLLPRRVLDPATALYAFCRVADDLVDTGADPASALADLHRRVGALYAGCPDPHPADRALAPVLLAHAIPRQVLLDLLEGFRWDVERRQYRDLAALKAYAARVAGTVGTAMALFMGACTPLQLARARELGIAMQLTNIARDVGEDARAGRLYLPLEWLKQEGLDAEAFLANPVPGPRLAAVLRRLLAEADRLYASADVGIATLPDDCRLAIAAARHLYAALGDEVVRQGYDSVTNRAHLSARRKLLALRRAFVAPRRPRRTLSDRAVWMLTLFNDLDLRQTGRP